jgi:hypothetical protein
MKGEYGGTAMAGGATADIMSAPKGSRPGYHEMEGRSGNHVTLPYARPPNAASRPLRTTGVSAIVPYNYTIVDTKTLGAGAFKRSPGPSQHR